MVRLYSTGCPKCKVLKSKLESANVEYDLIEDQDEVMAFAEEHNLREAPILVIDDEILTFKDALKHLN